ncbi:MAG: tetratricopeptide repeat protein [Saprospiraceae bacterium]|nr:tetratricopeptide repeat protein [Saprospiraceae bacterium]
MAKQNQSRPQRASQPSSAPVVSTEATVIPPFFTNIGMQSVLLFLLALLLYANTLGHQFVLDDYMVIKTNTFTQRGFAGMWDILTRDSFWGFFDFMKEDPKQMLVTGGRYRPLSLLFFAAIWQFFGENTFIFHLFTVLLYAATSILLYHLLLLMLKERFGEDYTHIFAWIATVIFICHPLHTEVAANIKGCDEIMALGGSLLTLYCAFKAWDTGAKKWWIGAIVSFFLASMSKENAVTFLIIVPLALWFFRTSPAENEGASLGYGKILGGMLAAFAVFFVLRGEVLDWSFSNEAPNEPMNNPFIKMVDQRWMPYTAGEKRATVFVTLGQYLKLLFYPHPLTHDYYPKQIAMTTFSNPTALLSLMAYVALGLYAVLGIRKRDIVRFGILYYLITLSIVSNLVFSVGTLMNERFLFMPSVGFCMAIAALLMAAAKKVSSGSISLPLGLTVAIAVLFSWRTLARNPIWASNEVLFMTDVKVSNQSAKANDDAGGVLFNEANEKDKEKDGEFRKNLLNEAIKHFDFALDFHPRYYHALMHRSACYYQLKNYEKSVEGYRKAREYYPDNPKVKDALALALRDYGRELGQQKNDPSGAYKALTESWALNSNEAQTAWLIGVSFAKQAKFAEAIDWFSKAVDAKPDNAGYVYDLGTAYHRSGNAVKGVEYYTKAKGIDPEIGKKRGEK